MPLALLAPKSMGSRPVQGTGLYWAIKKAQLRPYISMKAGQGFDVMGVAVWRRWPLDLTEQLLETTAENLKLKGEDQTQRRIDKEVERWRTETDSNDTQ